MSVCINSFVSNLNELTETNLSNQFDDFVSLNQSVINKHASLKQLSRKQQKLISKPWISKEI